MAEFDAAKYLDSPEINAAYLNKALARARDDSELVARAIGTVARAHGMMEVARDTGLNRENLYRALGSGGKPEFDTVMKVIDALGFYLEAKPKKPRRRKRPA
jgi:probable addiction module antidote protein